MNKVLLGTYLEKESFYHKIHPLIKIVLFFATSITTLIVSNLKAYLILTTIMLLSITLSGIGTKTFLKSIKPVAIIFLWTFVFQVIFNKEGELLLSLGFIRIYDKTLLNSILVFFRMFILVGASSILTLSTSPVEITHGFEDFFKPLKYIKVPVDAIALALSIALRFIPIFFEEVNRIEIAQKSKGMDIDELSSLKKWKFYALLLIPLLLSAIKKSEDIANAMEIKGYGIDTNRTRFREYKLSNEDLLLIIAYLISFVGVYILIIKGVV